jgi:hypothetical protein
MVGSNTMAHVIEHNTNARGRIMRLLIVVTTSMAALGFTASAHAMATFNAQAEALAEITEVTLASGQILTEGDIFQAISTNATRTGTVDASATGLGNFAGASFDGTEGADNRLFEVSANANGGTTSPGSSSASASATVTVVITNTSGGDVTVALRFADGIGSTGVFNLTTAPDSSGEILASTSCTAGSASPCTTGITLAAALGPQGGSATSGQPENILNPVVATTFSFTMNAAASGSVATAPPAQVPEPGFFALMTLGLLFAGGRMHRRRR